MKTNAQFSNDTEWSESKEFLEEGDKVDDFDGGVDYDDDEVANQTCKLDVGVLEKEAKYVVREYSCSLSRQLSIDE